MVLKSNALTSDCRQLCRRIEIVRRGSCRRSLRLPVCRRRRHLLDNAIGHASVPAIRPSRSGASDGVGGREASGRRQCSIHHQMHVASLPTTFLHMDHARHALESTCSMPNTSHAWTRLRAWCFAADQLRQVLLLLLLLLTVHPLFITTNSVSVTQAI